MGKVIVEKKNMGSHNILYEIREEGKSNFVSDKSLVNPIIEDFKKRDINFPRVFGVPRSGSTLIRNILNTMFDGRVKVQAHNYFSVNNKEMVVTTYRDFRDCTISKWRMNTGGFDRDKDLVTVNWNSNGDNYHRANTVSFCANALKRRVDSLNKFDKLYENSDNGFDKNDDGFMKTNRNIYFARYEQFHNNFDLILDHFEEFFEVTIVKDLRDFIQNTWNKDRIKRVYSDSISAFSGYDKDTEIHGQHIYKGKVGTWKDILKKEDHDHMTSCWKENLNGWGYEL